MSRLIQVACGPGRSGADTFVGALGCHRDVSNQALPPALLAAAVETLQFGAADSDSYLPRRAAQVFTAFQERLRAFGPHGEQATVHLRDSCAAEEIYVPVYGDLLLPGPRSTIWWAEAIRVALTTAGSPSGGWAVAKVGSGISAAALSLLTSEDVLVFVVRHPAVLLRTLTESITDGMLPVEAVLYLHQAFGHARTLLASVRARVVVVRLEEFCGAPRSVLPILAKCLDLPAWETDAEHWATAIQPGLPTDVRVPSDQTWPRDAILRRLAEEWGY